MRALGDFERAVLLALTRLGEGAYGVSIRQELEKRLARSISLGAVYTTLDRLLEKGMVSTHYGDPTPQRGGRAKKFFTIEGPGLAALEHARQSSEAIWSISALAGGK